MKPGPVAKNVDAYLAALPPAQRGALQRLRKLIRATAPKATEKIWYHMPAFFHQGPLVGFAAFKEHCSFFVGAEPIRAHKNELKPYPTEKGTIRFPAGKPLPIALVRKIVRTRMKENEARTKKRPSKKKQQGRKKEIVKIRSRAPVAKS